MALHLLPRLATLLCFAALQGCSFLFVDTPPTVAPDVQLQHVDCTSSPIAPVVDTIFAGLEAVRTGIALAASEEDYRNYPLSRGADIGFGLGFTALFAGSAIYGFVNTDECSELEKRVSAAPDPGPPVWIPAPAATPPPPPYAACTMDTHCKGDRICEGGRCVAPPPPAIQSPVPITPAPAPTPAPEAPAPAPAPAQPPVPSAPAQPPVSNPTP